MNMRIEIAERLHLEMREQIVDTLHAVEQRRHDHHGSRRRRHRVELEPGSRRGGIR